jgi:NADH-quinone oxidoreductase subunit C
MDHTALIAWLQDALPDAHVEPVSSVDLQATAYVDRDSLPAAMQTLRDRPQLRFRLLADLTATDFWPREPRFEVVYLLVSIEHALRLRLKVRLHGTDPRVATVSRVWPAANWLEREVWDLFGISFDGHPDQRRLLMPEDWEGHPLRKDYPVQIDMRPKTTEPTQLSPEEFRANVEKDRRARG